MARILTSSFAHKQKLFVIFALGMAMPMLGQDPFSLQEIINRLFAHPADPRGLEVKRLITAGDRVGCLVERIYSERRDSGLDLGVTLYLLNSSFEYPGSILPEKDRTPVCTLRLLNSLRAHTSDAGERSQIDRCQQGIVLRVSQAAESTEKKTSSLCRIFFEVTSRGSAVRFAQLSIPGIQETYQADESGKLRLTVPIGQTKSFHFSALGYKANTLNIACLEKGYQSYQVVLEPD